MNAPVTKLHPEVDAPVDPLARMREPFLEHQISKLPKPTKQQTDAVKDNFRAGVRCNICNSWHHPDVVHLDYVGHAALTDRLLDADPRWTWEPIAEPAKLGLPTAPGGMWIKLTIDGVTRLGYGDAEGKTGGNAVKETIGDALRNAGMRFGAALDLWHKGELHREEEGPPPPSAEEAAINLLNAASADKIMFKDVWSKNKDGWKNVLDRNAYNRVVKVMQDLAAKFPAEPTATANEPAPDRPPPGEISRAASATREPPEEPLLDDEIPF